MKHLRWTIRSEALLAAVAFFPARSAQAAVRCDDPKKPGEVHLPLPSLGPQDKNDPHAEMRKLFGKIERDLRQIDQLLANASAGSGAGASEGAGASGTAGAAEEAKSRGASAVDGIDRLLATSEERGKSVLDSIDRILELASHDPSSSSSSCESAGGICKGSGNSKSSSKEKGSAGKEPGQDESSGGKSLLDRQGGTTTQRESTPEGPGEKGSQKPESKDASRDSQGKNGPKPAGNQSSKAPAENAAGDPNGDAKTGEARGAGAAGDKWGDLPVHVRDVFRTQGGGDMPAQYRDWIDAYYRRMAKKAGS
jgi:hypothetical protein